MNVTHRTPAESADQRLRWLASEIRELRIAKARAAVAANELPADPGAHEELQAQAFAAKTRLEMALNDYFDLSEAGTR